MRLSLTFLLIFLSIRSAVASVDHDCLVINPVRNYSILHSGYSLSYEKFALYYIEREARPTPKITITKGTPETKVGARVALVGATMGYYFSDHLRWEVNFNYSLNNKFYGNNQGSSLTSLSMFKVKAYQFSIATSLLYYLKKDSEISPFIGAFIGGWVIHITTSAVSPKSFLGKNNDLIFFKAALGIDYNINLLVQLQLAYDINYNTKKPDLINFNEDLLNAVSDPKTQMIKLPKILLRIVYCLTYCLI
ncbi:MAG: hypothetical protein MRQ13_02220 [Candidatus Midichloria sp.]|nr:hypothetical protein [Candidatus Midichloria sp.]